MPRAAQAAFGLVFYVWRTLVPRNLIPIHELPEPFDVGSARFVVPLIAVIVAVVALVALRKRAPALVTAAVAYAIILAPVSGITQAGPQLVADRYSYLACMPFAVLAGCAVAWAWASRPDLRAIVATAVVVVAGVLGVLTFRQSRCWHDSEALWRRTIAVSPASPNARINLAAVLVQRGVESPDPIERARLWNEAQTHLELGLAVHADPQMHVNLGLLALLRAQDDMDKRLPLAIQALEHIDRGLTLGQEQSSYRPEWRLARASALMAGGRCPEAVDILEALERSAPATEALPRTLALAYACAGRKADALARLDVALRVEPDDATLWLRAGELARDLGRIEDARTAYRRVLDLRRAQLGAGATGDAQWKQARQALDQLH